MYALPPKYEQAEAPQVTGISCPSCHGVLTVYVVHRALTFRCRVGHAFSTRELLEANELRLDEWLWAAVTGFSQLIALLDDLTPVASEDLQRRYAERRDRAADARALLMQVIGENEPLDLGEANDAETDQDVG